MSEVPGVRTRPVRMPRGTYAGNLRVGEFSMDPCGFVVHPDDLIGAERHPDVMWSIGCCRGPDGLGGLNLVCAGCGAAVATRQADCFTQDQVTLEPSAICISFADD